MERIWHFLIALGMMLVTILMTVGFVYLLSYFVVPVIGYWAVVAILTVVLVVVIWKSTK